MRKMLPLALLIGVILGAAVPCSSQTNPYQSDQLPRTSFPDNVRQPGSCPMIDPRVL
jgi:hypothetical protein